MCSVWRAHISPAVAGCRTTSAAQTNCLSETLGKDTRAGVQLSERQRKRAASGGGDCTKLPPPPGLARCICYRPSCRASCQWQHLPAIVHLSSLRKLYLWRRSLASRQSSLSVAQLSIYIRQPSCDRRSVLFGDTTVMLMNAERIQDAGVADAIGMP